VMGAGAAKRLSAVRWGVAGSIAGAWIITLPAAGLFGAAAYAVATAFGSGPFGPALLAAALLGALTTTLAARHRRMAETASA
jgi:inorganic phosphate transporter, PiT family